jgi:pyrroloquinoline quinone (PQQ) biosynthesis protein C
MYATKKVLASLPESKKGIDEEMITITPHPDWVESFLDFIRPYQESVANHRLFEEFKKGSLTIRQCQGALVNFYPLIESFPQYMALSLTKIPGSDSPCNQKARDWLIRNIHQERLHSEWWRQFAAGFKVDVSVFDEEIHPPPEMDAINNYLWRVCTHGTLAEGMSASNFAIEGATGEWAKNIRGSFEQYSNTQGIVINDRTLEWVSAHASYDDRHPVEALEIIKAFATTLEEQEKVKQAAKRSLEYYSLALESCYEMFG